MADPQKTEKPTKKRLDKAREQGQQPSARQFIGGVQFCVFVALLDWKGAAWFEQTARSARKLLDRAFAADLTTADLIWLSRDMVYRCFVPLLLGGAVLVGLTLALQLALTKMGFAFKKLAPDFQRLNPLSKLQRLPMQNLQSLLQAVILLPVFGFAIYAITSEQFDHFLSLPLSGIRESMLQVTGTVRQLLWRAASLFLVFGLVDLYREKRRHSGELRMTKQEIKDEMKESEGSPLIKGKFRALRRDLARRRMMQDVPKATAVVVNPTHFAVALLYDPDSMLAPRVVAKGKNYLALRIRQKAAENQVPLIENPPLAQALYKSVDLGQDIPPHLYRAVAEILAYIFKVMKRR
jgi:flagellar biosynthetic protein FlhB